MPKIDVVDFASRVKQIRKALKLSQQDFAKNLGLSGSFISDVESCRSRAGLDFIYGVATIYNVNLYFLILGKGEMFVKPKDVVALADKRLGEPVNNIDELVAIAEKSQFFCFSILSQASKCIYGNRDHILEEIKVYDELHDNDGKSD